MLLSFITSTKINSQHCSHVQNFRFFHTKKTKCTFKEGFESYLKQEQHLCCLQCKDIYLIFRKNLLVFVSGLKKTMISAATNLNLNASFIPPEVYIFLNNFLIPQ